MDDDDEWLPTKLEKQVQLFEQLDEEFGIVYCWMNYCRDGDGEVVREYRPASRGNIFPETLDGQPIGAGSTLLVRKLVAEEVNGFDESLPQGVDGDFIQRVSQEYKVDYVPELLVRYYVEHSHQRITRDDAEGLRNHINSLQKTLSKFDDQLEEYPGRAANIYGNMGYHYRILGERRSSLTFYLKSIQTAPTSYTAYRWVLRMFVRPLPQYAVDTLRDIRDHSVPQLVGGAIRIWWEDGFQHLLNSIINKHEEKIAETDRQSTTFLKEVLTLFHEIHLLVDEGLLAYPWGCVWKLFSLTDSKDSRVLPTLSSRVAGTRHGSAKHRQMMNQLYTCEDFVEIETGDIVVDVGAYVGGVQWNGFRKGTESHCH